MTEDQKTTQDTDTPATQEPTAQPEADKSGKPADTLQLTQDALNAMNKDARMRGEAAILKQFGIADRSKLPDVLAAYNAYLEAERNKETDGDRLKSLSEQFDGLKNEHTAALAEIAALRQEKILRKHGLTDDEDIEIYGIRIGKLVTEEKDFEQAADEYFKAHPKQERPPEFYVGAGRSPAKKEADMNKVLFGALKK